MEKKIGLIIILGTIVVILMFYSLRDNDKNFLIISDGITANSEMNFNYLFYKENSNDFKTYNNSYTINNLSARDLYDLINYNELLEGDEYTIKQLINMSEVISISIGLDEINNHANINIYLYYMDLVLYEIRKINDNEIFLIGLYSTDVLISNVNDELENLCRKYNITYIDIENIVNFNYIEEDTYLLNEEGHKLIFNEFLRIYESK